MEMERALWYIEHMGTHVRYIEDTDCFYMLRKHNTGNFERSSKRFIAFYDAALEGNMDPRLEGDAANLADVCMSVPKLTPPDREGKGWEVPDCEGDHAVELLRLQRLQARTMAFVAMR
jgi:hypothetical protein